MDLFPNNQVRIFNSTSELAEKFYNVVGSQNTGEEGTMGFMTGGNINLFVPSSHAKCAEDVLPSEESAPEIGSQVGRGLSMDPDIHHAFQHPIHSSVVDMSKQTGDDTSNIQEPISKTEKSQEIIKRVHSQPPQKKARLRKKAKAEGFSVSWDD